MGAPVSNRVSSGGSSVGRGGSSAASKGASFQSATQNASIQNGRSAIVQQQTAQQQNIIAPQSGGSSNTPAASTSPNAALTVNTSALSLPSTTTPSSASTTLAPPTTSGTVNASFGHHGHYKGPKIDVDIKETCKGIDITVKYDFDRDGVTDMTVKYHYDKDSKCHPCPPPPCGGGGGGCGGGGSGGGCGGGGMGNCMPAPISNCNFNNCEDQDLLKLLMMLLGMMKCGKLPPKLMKLLKKLMCMLRKKDKCCMGKNGLNIPTQFMNGMGNMNGIGNSSGQFAGNNVAVVVMMNGNGMQNPAQLAGLASLLQQSMGGGFGSGMGQGGLYGFLTA